MPQRILEAVFAETKLETAEAIDLLVEHLPKVIRKWRSALRTLSLRPQGLRLLTGLDLYQGLMRFRGMSYRTLRSELKHLAGELADAGIQSEQALGAVYLLLEQCLPYLHQRPSNAFAVTRLAGVVAGMIVAGYSAHWESSRLSLSDRLVDARRRLHPASAYVTQVYEMERRKLSHDLHDEIGHDLMLLKLYLEVMLRDLRSVGPEALEPKLEQTLAVVQHAIDSARRLVLDLGPAIFDELGFQAAIRSYVKQFSQRTGVQADLRVGPLPDEIPMSHQVALYRVLQGALGNVFKHANASRVTVTVGRVRDGELFLVVEDDGVGFDLAEPRKEGSVGLIAMRERIEVLGGSFHIDSAQPGTLRRKRGTRVEVGLPLPKAARRAHARKRAMTQ
jgi:signal transduction histidine kinase